MTIGAASFLAAGCLLLGYFFGRYFRVGAHEMETAARLKRLHLASTDREMHFFALCDWLTEEARKRGMSPPPAPPGLPAKETP